MKLSTSFVLCLAHCDLEDACACVYERVYVEAEATWDPVEEEAFIGPLVFTRTESGGLPPKWEDMSRREQSFALDAVNMACDEEKVRDEFEAARLPFVRTESTRREVSAAVRRELEEALRRFRETSHV